MVLELIHVEPYTIFLAMNYMPHLLLPFAYYWTGNHKWDLVISDQSHMYEVSQTKAPVEGF